MDREEECTRRRGLLEGAGQEKEERARKDLLWEVDQAGQEGVERKIPQEDVNGAG